MTRSWRLDTSPNIPSPQTLILAACDNRLPAITYWGPALPEAEDSAQCTRAQTLESIGAMLDEVADCSICPEESRSFPGQPGLRLYTADGNPLFPCFDYHDHKHDPQSLKITYRDPALAIDYWANFQFCPDTGVLKSQSGLIAEKPVRLYWLSAPAFPAPHDARDLVDFSGRWCREFQPITTSWQAGIRLRDNRTGRSSHEHFPGLYLPVNGATNNLGHVYAFHYGWSGGHGMIAEELPDGRRQLQFGHAPGTQHSPARTFETALLYGCFSGQGWNGCAVSFQRYARDHIVSFPAGSLPRPVHYNCWEAIYFDHKLDVLTDIASKAADLGAERFVLDDGWFAGRNDDTTSLSHWQVDPQKYPDGLNPLINHIHHCGMQFGLWVEPEMVSPGTDIDRTKPDWILGTAHQVLGRHQKVLNLALPAVQDFLFESLAGLLSEYAIDYLKWDHNRVLPQPDAAQTHGVYRVLERIREKFPAVEIESCASGGGRIDFGILHHTHRFWLSDSNDAIERVRIQHHAALFLPAALTGSHVGPEICKTSGRRLDINFRGWVAAQRHMGLELDPRELNTEDERDLKKIIGWWKANRDWMMAADILRLDHPDPAVIGEMQLSADRTKFVVFLNRIDSSAQILPRPVKLTGLLSQKFYTIRLVDQEDRDDLCLSGAYLMGQGVLLPDKSYPATVQVLEGKITGESGNG